MTIKEIILNESIASDSGLSLNDCVAESKNLLKRNNKPYSLKDSVDGPKTKVVFTEHFIYVMIDADSTECMAKMSLLEKYLYWDYLNYQGIVNSIMFAHPEYTDEEVDAAALIEYDNTVEYDTPELVVRTLSDWAYAETLQFDKDSCYDIMHSWEA